MALPDGGRVLPTIGGRIPSRWLQPAPRTGSRPVRRPMVGPDGWGNRAAVILFDAKHDVDLTPPLAALVPEGREGRPHPWTHRHRRWQGGCGRRGAVLVWAIMERVLQLVAKAAQQCLAVGNVLFSLDPPGAGSVDDAQNAASLVGLGEEHLHGVGGGAIDRADLGNGA